MTTVTEVFGTGGILSQKFAGYEARRGQVDVASAIEAALAKGGHVLADAPTGVGKSIAYLVPAIARAVSTRTRAIVVTANIALQEQLIEKDLPSLARIMPERFTFALMKGKNNYLCLSNMEKALSEGLLHQDPAVRRAFAWAQETETGDSSEHADGFPPGTWKKLSVASDECKGSSCRYHEKCFAEVAKRKAANATIIVTNYHLYFAHLVVRAKMRADKLARGEDPREGVDLILPKSPTIIFDEAHAAAKIAREFMGFQVTRGQVDALLRGFDHEVATACGKRATAFFDEARALARSPQYRARIRRAQMLVATGPAFAGSLRTMGKFYSDARDAGAWSDEERAELSNRSKRSHVLADQVDDVSTLKDDGKVVYFLEENEREQVACRMMPIDVAPFLREELFAQHSSVIMTSATLATGTGPSAFSFVKGELGCDSATELTAESPFDFAKQCMLVLPKTMLADPNDREQFPFQVARHVRAACEVADGRTLALFTSYRCMDRAREEMEGFRHAVFTQKDGPKAKVVARFKADVHSVLLGCESFWAGIDCPGETCSQVVIDRVPFPTPDDPIVDAIQSRDDRWFFNYAIPRAIIAIRQAFGRLIRTRGDRGVCVLLDPRLRTKGYGSAFIRALPKGMTMSDDIKDAKAFLAASGAS